jgi:hypothetical protein
MTPLDTALQWHNEGIATIPIRYRSKRPMFPWKTYQEKLPDEADIKEWFKSKFCNMAVITGYRNLTILDFDTPDIWQLWESWINIQMPNLLCQTYRVKTRRGQHVYLFLENPPERTLKIRNEQNQTLIDVKAAGGYCLAPYSIHPSGHRYTGFNLPSNIVTVGSLDEVLPCMLMEKATAEIEIPQYQNGSCDIWSITPELQNGDAIAWIKSNRSVLEFFPHAVSSGGNRWYKVLCPFHNDHSESGWIDTQRDRFGCQACMNGSLDVIDLYAMLKKVDRKQAIRELL